MHGTINVKKKYADIFPESVESLRGLLYIYICVCVCVYVFGVLNYQH